MQGGGSNGGEERAKSCQSVAVETVTDSLGRLQRLEIMSARLGMLSGTALERDEGHGK